MFPIKIHHAFLMSSMRITYPAYLSGRHRKMTMSNEYIRDLEESGSDLFEGTIVSFAWRE
jgi:hypothetical protein